MLAQCDCIFPMHILFHIMGTQQLIFFCVHQYCHAKYPEWPFLKNMQYPPLLFLDNLEVLHKFLCIVEIISPVILQM